MTRGRWSMLLVLALAGAVVGGVFVFARTSSERTTIAQSPATQGTATSPQPALATPSTAPAGPRFAAFDCARPVGAAARVDDATITLADLCGRLQRLGAVTPQGTVRQQARDALDHMIDATLVRRALERDGAAVTNADLATALTAMGPSVGADVELLSAQLRERLELKKLVAGRTGLAVTEQDVDAELASGAPGIDRGQGIRVEGFIARIAPKADAAESQTRAEAFAKNPSPTAAATHEMTALAPFVVGESGIEPALEAAASSLPKGAWSGALRTRVGYAVIRVVGAEQGTSLDAPPLRARVRQALETRRLQAAQQRVLEELRAAARIEHVIDVR